MEEKENVSITAQEREITDKEVERGLRFWFHLDESGGIQPEKGSLGGYLEEDPKLDPALYFSWFLCSVKMISVSSLDEFISVPWRWCFSACPRV